MARKPLTTVAVVVGIIAIFTSAVGVPTWLAVDGTIGLVTTEPVRVTDVKCVNGPARNDDYCVGSWTLSNGDEVRDTLSSAMFVGTGDSFDGYGNDSTAAPTLLFWIAQQLLYLIPIALIVLFVRFHRRRLRNAGKPLSEADSAAMDARAEEIRRRRNPPAISG